MVNENPLILKRGLEDEEGAMLLQKERATSSVRPEAMATFIFGGQEALSRRLRALAFIESDPVFDTKDRNYLDQKSRYMRSSEKVVHLVLKCRRLGIPFTQMLDILNVALDEITPTDVHTKMAIPSLMHQTTPEQRAKWLPLAENFRIICAYAQTELGHGSNVRALETIATYEPSSQSFILHSPRLESAKWWPGGLGKSATHAIVLARLLLGGKDRGLHSFIVQLRDLRDHTPLPGVTLGDIGPKLGFMSVDNGFCLFDHVRVPREHMLMGLAEISPDGHYRKRKGANGGEKILYGAMLDVRAGLVERGGATLARALTVAIRYSAVRRQGYASSPPGKLSQSAPLELQVLDYPTQQHALMPLLAWSFALQITGQFMRRRYKAYLRELDLSLLPEVHALSSGLKALTGEVVSQGVDVCRRMCGGHGYLLASGLPEVFSNYTAVQTFEGTAQVLEPQLARFILRLSMAPTERPKGSGRGAATAAKAPFALSSDFDYVPLAAGKTFVRCRAATPVAFLDPAFQIEAYEARVSALLLLAREEVEADLRGGEGGLAASMMKNGVLFGRLSRAHCQLVLLRRFHEAVAREEGRVTMTTARDGGLDGEGNGGRIDRGAADGSEEGESEDREGSVTVGPAEVRVLRNLCHLFALSGMERDMAEFRARDYLSSGQAEMVSREVLRLNRTVRAEAVSLVDAWLLSDKLLGSALGRADGRVYGALFEEALRSPLNDKEVSEAYTLHWRRLLMAGDCAWGNARL